MQNPYGHYPRRCGLITLGSALAALPALALPELGSILLLSFAIATGSMAALTGLILWPIARLGDRQVQLAMEGQPLAHWTYPAETWNAFAAMMRARLSPAPVVPLLLFPACGAAASLTSAITHHWLWLPVGVSSGVLLTAVSLWLQRWHSRQRYQNARGEAEVLITQGLLAIPGQVFIWNHLSPILLDVIVEGEAEGESHLVFHIGSKGRNGMVRSEIVLPIPAGRRSDAKRLLRQLF